MYRYIIKNKGLYSVYAILLVVSSTMSVFFAFVLSEIMNCAAEGNLQRLMRVLIVGIVFLLVTVFSEFFYGITKNKLICKARQDLKHDLFDRILHKNVTNFESRNTGDYMNDLQNNLNMYEELYFNNILQIPMIVFSFFVAVITCIYIKPLMLLLILVIGGFTALVVKHTGKMLERSTGGYAEQSASYSGEIKDDFRGYRIISSYHLYDEIIRRHEQANEKQEKAKEINGNDKTLFLCLNELAGLTSTVIIMALAAYFAIKGSFTVGIVIAFGQLSGKIISPIMTASDTWIRFKSSKKLTEKYMAILHSEEDNHPKREKQAVYGDIRLTNVSLIFNEKKGLNNFSAVFKKGKKYLVVGERGSGKSTLLNIISGMYDEYDGEVMIEDEKLKQVERNSLSHLVSLASQEVFLFNDTIRNNITLYREYSDEQIHNVLKQCGLENLIQGLPDGLDTLVGENGSNFSGGEKQRINLARAFIRDSKILLLDEVSANLDSVTTDFIERTVLALEGKTVISVAHKMPEKLAELYDEVIRVGV